MRRLVKILMATAIGVGSLGVVATIRFLPDVAHASDSAPTMGRIPDDAYADDGMLIRERVPDYVAVWNRSGTEIAGYVSKEEAFPPPSSDWDGTDAPLTVYDGTLKSVVGHMYPGRGFIAIGEDPESVRPAQMYCSDDGTTVVAC